ncbi:MAG TPA: hypothetical protein VFL47_12230 [Flavisolibacter sp.]|nr:hypothetical protein [Flavisolibacter sp.]
MDTNNKNQSSDKQQSDSMSSFNNRPDNRKADVENVKENKEVDEGFMDYNGNSEANAPTRAREGEE